MRKRTTRALFQLASRVWRSLPARLGARRDLKRARTAISRFPLVKNASKHHLPGELIISLTSYPARFPTLALTCKGLLDQYVRADRVILWIAEDDDDQLPADVRSLQQAGLEIRLCPDLRSYKKIIPTLELFPHSFIVTADDDVYYDPSWLQTLITPFDPSDPAILCRRAHRITRDRSGAMRPYQEWEWQVTRHHGVRSDLFPTGVGGILYYPGCFIEEVTDAASALELCRFGDDIWLYWMARLAGSRHQQVGPYFRAIEWEGSQRTSLFADNAAGRNDEQTANIIRAFGSV